MAIEDRLAANRGREMGLTAVDAALEDETAALGGEPRDEGRAEQQGAKFGLDAEAGLATMLDLGGGARVAAKSRKDQAPRWACSTSSR